MLITSKLYFENNSLIRKELIDSLVRSIDNGIITVVNYSVSFANSRCGLGLLSALYRHCAFQKEPRRVRCFDVNAQGNTE